MTESGPPGVDTPLKADPEVHCYAVLRSLLECSGWLHFKLSGAIESARVGSGAAMNWPVTEVGDSMSSKNWCSKATRQVGCDRLRSKSSPVVAPWLEGFCVTPARARIEHHPAANSGGLPCLPPNYVSLLDQPVVFLQNLAQVIMGQCDDLEVVNPFHGLCRHHGVDDSLFRGLDRSQEQRV